LHYAASGAEALERLAGEIQPKLVAVLSDINMPGMDGLELLAEIKQRFPGLPVMMVTAYGDNERRRVAAEKGAAVFITKPLDFDQLKAQLRDAERRGLNRRVLPGQIVQELRRRIDAGHEQMVSGTGAGDIKEMPLGLVDFFEVGVVGDILDPPCGGTGEPWLNPENRLPSAPAVAGEFSIAGFCSA
jgi:CheY-like chemotaxis protein